MSSDAAAPRPATLVVLAWNRWDLTQRCLRSLLATDLGDARVLVVDNGSSDETPLRLAELATADPRVEVLTLPENLGFVRGNNAALDHIDAQRDVVLLNNDVEFPQADWLSRLRATAYSASDVGIVGCRLVDARGALLHAGTYILPDTMWGQQIGSGERDLGQFTVDRDVQGIVFACAYLRREVIVAIGGLSTEFESYFEDTDYCLRAIAARFRVRLCGSVTLVHDEHGSTHSDDKRRRDLFQRSRRRFRELWQSRLDGAYRGAVAWQSLMNLPTGYATSSRYLIQAMEEEGVRVFYRYLYGPGTVFPRLEPTDAQDYRLNVVRERPLPRRPEVAVVYGQGDVFRYNLGKRKVGYTMLEVDGFPRDWVAQANKMDEVWVPSLFNRQGFLSSGLKRPIHIVPLGVDTDRFHPGVAGRANPRGEFVFLSLFEWGERKEPWILLRAFSETFTRDEPVRLVCRVNNLDPAVRVREEIRKLNLRSDGGRISYIFNLEFPHYEMPTLYRSADAFVSVSRGEGWDMPLMEAMACGLPSIATDWGAHQEFAHSGNSYPLAISGTVPAVAKCPYYAGFRWAEPDIDHLRVLFRQVYEQPDEARRIGLEAAREMQSRWTWRNAARVIAERLEALR